MRFRSTAAAAAAGLATLLLVSGCGSFGKADYKSTATLRPLEVPPDLSTPQTDQQYTVPEASSATYSQYQKQGERQAGAGAAAKGILPTFEGMRIERDGDERWLVVQQPPEKLWAKVKRFWEKNGFAVEQAHPEAGVMETNWAEKHPRVVEAGIRGLLSRAIGTIYSTGERDKFRTRFERTPDGTGTEIYITHRGLEQVYVGRDNEETKWEPRKPDPGLEAEFLRRLMVDLGASEDSAKAMLATAKPAPQVAALEPAVAGGKVLQVDEPFDRAWRLVGLALDRGGFTVEDRDRQAGLYYVRYADPENGTKKDDRGLLARIFTSAKPKVEAEQYRIQVREEQGRSRVRVLDKSGAPDASKTGQRILSLLGEQLK